MLSSSTRPDDDLLNRKRLPFLYTKFIYLKVYLKFCCQMIFLDVLSMNFSVLVASLKQAGHRRRLRPMFVHLAGDIASKRLTLQ